MKFVKNFSISFKGSSRVALNVGQADLNLLVNVGYVYLVKTQDLITFMKSLYWRKKHRDDEKVGFANRLG